jgi:nitrogen regulatory protein P-II 1
MRQKHFSGLAWIFGRMWLSFWSDSDLVEPVLSAIKEAGRFSEPGTGIAFVLAVEQTVGFESQLSKPLRKLLIGL